MIRIMADFFSGIVKRWLPDAFLFAAILTVVVFLAGIVAEHRSPVEMISYWGTSFWSLLAFSMQMVLILVTGYVLAKFKDYCGDDAAAGKVEPKEGEQAGSCKAPVKVEEAAKDELQAMTFFATKVVYLEPEQPEESI